MKAYAFADLALSRRLERTEAAANASFVEARARTHADIGATWIDVDGVWAMFDGVDSPCSQTFGFGLFSAPRVEQLEAIEAFFGARQCTVMHEVSPLAEPSALTQLSARGYVPIELSSVMHQPIGRITIETRSANMQVRIANAVERSVWADASAHGWSDFVQHGDFMRDLALVTANGHRTTCFLVEIDDVIAATGSIAICEGVALMAGASTVPQYRGRGAQNALLQARIAYAAECDCDLALMVAQPGSSSQRNAERQGFRIAYTRTKWSKA